MPPKPSLSFATKTASLLLGVWFALAASAEDKFTLAVIPDSQQEVLQEGDARLQNRLEWLVKQRRSLNLKMVLHVGDLMNWDTPDHLQAGRASAAFTVLDKAGLPYACALGNHDTAAVKVGGSAAPGNVNSNLRITTTYNAFFPLARFKALESVYQPGQIDNACHTFRAGGLDWLVLNLELWARTGAVAWAETVLQQHPHHNAITLTHSHLNSKGGIEQTKGGYGNNSPQFVFDHLQQYPNVRLVFSGHVGTNAFRTDLGTNGNPIHQFLQCYHDKLSNPVRLFEIDTKKGTLKTWVYSPATKQEKHDGTAMTIKDIQWVPIAPPPVPAAQLAKAKTRWATPAGKNKLFWCDSTDTNKLDLVVEQQGDKCLLSNVARYQPADKNCYYYVNWDLQGTSTAGQPISRLEVEPNSLYLVHLYEISQPKNLNDFWAKDSGKQACSAMVWVGGRASTRKAKVPRGATGALTEVKESPKWFSYAREDRLPFFSQRFPEFHLPTNKVLCLNLFSQQDTVAGYQRHGITHFTGGGGVRNGLPPRQRLLTIGSYFNQGIGEKPSGDPHISPTENTFMQSDPAHAIKKAAIASQYDYIFLDEEFWHNDYQTATIERLCLFAQEAKRVNPTLKLADFWNPPPYRFSFVGRDRWTPDSIWKTALSHYDDLEVATKAGNQTLLRKVVVNDQPTSLAEELTAVSICVYFDNLFGYIKPYETFSLDYFVPAAIHTTRLNRRLPCNQGKPLIWFGMDILEGNYEHPRIAYPTRTTHPPGLAIFKDRLLVSPNYNEALGIFGLLEADGAYLWDAHGTSDGSPDGIFSTLRYCVDYKDDRGEWHPDVPGTAIGTNRTWYPYNMAFAADYYALGAWKYAQIAGVVNGGQRVDFEYSLDSGKTWYQPPANGGTLPDVIHEKRPFVTGAVKGREIAVVAFHPFQGVADTTPLWVRYGKNVLTLNLFGTRARVYRGKLAR
jgi:hypothetical protein